MITILQENFDIRQIADSGQCFRMRPAPEKISENHSFKGPFDSSHFEPDQEIIYEIISGGRFLTLSQKGNRLNFFCSPKDMVFWNSYFDLDTDYGRIIRQVDPDDAYLKEAAAFGSGIRILRQDLWEMIITFVISQQKTIPAIKAAVEALSGRYGTRHKVPVECLCQPSEGPLFYYAFPSPCQLSEASLEDLLSMKLGYRAKYIKKLCEDACSGALNLAALAAMDYPQAMTYLQTFYGIGEKVANCVCLFGLHHIDAFPVDTWIRKILLEHYAPRSRCAKETPPSRLCDALVKEHFARYRGYAGVMQQYIFYYERFRTRLSQSDP